MKIIKKAQAGSFESSDLMVLVEPNEDTVPCIEINSSVELQYGDQIRELVYKKINELGVKNIHLIIKDKGALPPTICARVETAVKRAAGLSINEI